MWACALRGNEEVCANLSRMCDTLVAATELTSGAMLSDGQVHAQVGRRVGGAGPGVGHRAEVPSRRELKAAMAGQERERVVADTARNEAKQSH